MKITFINREQEIGFLEDLYKEKGSNLAIIYGRRRVGKTEIIRNFLKGKNSIYFLADKRGTKSNSQRFTDEAAAHLQDIAPSVENFDKAFEYLAKREKKIIIVIDEFSYLVESDPAIPSIFQLILDEILKNKDFFLILCGSSISMMEEGALSYKSPLYGRRGGQWMVKPLKFQHVQKFFTNYSFEQVIEAFSVIGNIPAYIVKLDDSKTVFENIKEKILKKGTFLFEEAEFLLKEELKDPSTYCSILEAIGSGATKITEIADKSHTPAKDLPKYLKVLQKLQLVEKIQPATEKEGKKSVYKISDPFFVFWFKFAYPNKSYLESENLEYVMDKIKNEFNSFVGFAFEKVCKEVLYELNKAKAEKSSTFAVFTCSRSAVKHSAHEWNNVNKGKELPFSFSKIGTWWGHYRDENNVRKELEIDIVALNEEKKEILFGECKWKDKVDAEKIAKELMEKAKCVQWNNDKRKEHFAIFAKSFKNKPKGCLCFDLRDIHKLLS